MGIQIGVNYEDVAHLIVAEEDEEYGCGRCSQCVDAWGAHCFNSTTVVYYKLQHKDVEMWMSSSGGGNWLWCDANHWGSNREKILFILNENNISYTEG